MTATESRVKDLPIILPEPSEATSGEQVEQATEEWVEKFRGYYDQWGTLLQQNLDRLSRGSYSLHWLDTEHTHWGTRVQPSSRGLTAADIDRPKVYGTLPDHTEWRNFAPRGSARDLYADAMPVIEGYDVLDKSHLWADNVNTLYEEAKVRQWNSTTDIPWTELEPVSEELEKAACQLSTFLTEVEFVAGDFPARWVWRTAPDFFEVKNFLTTQMVDEARHMEVFRKRALANGGGLGMAIALGGALKLINAPAAAAGRTAGSTGSPLADNPLFSTWRDVSYCIHVVFEGAVLSIFRFGEFLGKTDVDKSIFRMVMQDEARHVAYGAMHLKYLLEGAPDPDAQREDLHRLADLAEMFFTDLFFMQPATVESLAILAGDGIGGVGAGLEVYKDVYRKLREEYLSRTARAGLDRRGRCFFPEELPF